jgi:hypothetical protein
MRAAIGARSALAVLLIGLFDWSRFLFERLRLEMRPAAYAATLFNGFAGAGGAAI